jgi:DNA polymerase I-like protein with 3'-5' exonuclease and polymerase domains
VAEGAGISDGEAKQLIKWYFTTFPDLAKWLTSNQGFVKESGFLYSHFGRKRRVNNVFSPDRGVVGHAVRSAINFLVQSVASDVNLLAAIEMQSRIEAAGKNIKIFALVHDSILAEVPEAEVDWYVTNLRECTQKDRGVSIPGFPVPVDVEIGNNYKFTDDVFKEAA